MPPMLKNKIFIVDDDQSVRHALGLLLDSYGFAVQTFASAPQFLDSFLYNASGCLVLDVHMAQMNGFVLQQRLNAHGFKLPIIFISADKTLELSKEYLTAAGAIGFLQKPFHDKALLDLIDVALERR
jgi:FixJ family two-component response regulator